MLKIQKHGQAVTISAEPSKELPKAKVKSGVITEDQAKINSFVALFLELEAMDVFSKVKDLEEMKKVVAAMAKDGDFPAEAKAILKGTIGEVEFSACSNSTEIVDKAGLIAKLGQEQFNQLAKINLGDLKKYLSENELSAFTMSGYGSRSMKAVRGYE